MIILPPGRYETILVKPRSGKKQVLIDERALSCLLQAQALLNPQYRLILTRAYQPETMRIKYVRKIGAGIFRLLYRKRKGEAEEIFHHNGHAENGMHLDVSIAENGHPLLLLPFSVFTPQFLIARIEMRHRQVLQHVTAALHTAGFTIHANKTEALQIHCDLY